MIAFFLSLLMCWTLRLALPLFKSDQLEKTTRKNFHTFFCTILKDKWFHVNELLKRFHLNGNTRGFHPQTQKLELCTKQIVPSATTAEEASFEWPNHRISSSQTQKLQKHYKSPRVKKFICDNEWFNTFSLWWKSLSTTISRFFAFKRPAYLKLNQNKSSLRFFLISP